MNHERIRKIRQSSGALLWGIAMPGLGQIYLGQGEIGLILYLLPHCILLACWWYTNSLGVVLSLLNLILFYIFATLAAFYKARRMKETRPKTWYNNAFILLLLWFIHLCLPLSLSNPKGFLGSEVVIRSFKAKSDAMEPHILRGDLFFVNHRDDVREKVQSGDIVVVRVPSYNDEAHVRLVAAVAGESFTFYNGSIQIAGRELPCSNAILNNTWRDVSTEESGHIRVTLDQNQIFLISEKPDLYPDSRLWGPVPPDYLVGKAEFIIFPRKGRHRFGTLAANPTRL